jgi:peptide/nickel transport system permease protein
VLLLLIAVCAATAPLLSVYSPDDISRNERLRAPNSAHPFGTDDLGRDLFVRVMQGGRASVAVGITTIVFALLVGVAGGGIAGFYGGVAGSIVMRLADVMLSIPAFLIILLSASILSPGFILLCMLIGSMQWMEVARVVRTAVVATRERDFVEAARALGLRKSRILFRHVLPHAGGPVLIAGTVGLAQAIVIESTLSFFGFGLQPPSLSWGSLLRDSQGYMASAPWIAVFPGFMIFVTVLCCFILGNFLQTAVDPRRAANWVSPRV